MNFGKTYLRFGAIYLNFGANIENIVYSKGVGGVGGRSPRTCGRFRYRCRENIPPTPWIILVKMHAQNCTESRVSVSAHLTCRVVGRSGVDLRAWSALATNLRSTRPARTMRGPRSLAHTSHARVHVSWATVLLRDATEVCSAIHVLRATAVWLEYTQFHTHCCEQRNHTVVNEPVRVSKQERTESTLLQVVRGPLCLRVSLSLTCQVAGGSGIRF